MSSRLANVCLIPQQSGDTCGRSATESEAETIRQKIHPKLNLPELADVEREHGRVHKLNEVARQLGISKTNAEKYGHKLGVLIRIRNGIKPTYVVKNEDVTLIWIEKQESLKRWTQDCRERAARAAQLSARKRRHRDLLKQERNYYGRVQIFSIEATAVADHELSSEAGPQMVTLQYRPCYPSTDEPDLDTAAWNKTN